MFLSSEYKLYSLISVESNVNGIKAEDCFLSKHILSGWLGSAGLTQCWVYLIVSGSLASTETGTTFIIQTCTSYPLLFIISHRRRNKRNLWNSCETVLAFHTIFRLSEWMLPVNWSRFWGHKQPELKLNFIQLRIVHQTLF